jgi:hypothetical protein
MGYNDICVVHLIRACNGIEPLKRFLISYEHHPSGLEHDLIFILKGFKESEIPVEIDSLLNQFNHQRINVPDEGYDIGSYMTAAQVLENKYLCFFNSFSEILGDNWLEKLFRHVSSSGSGMVSPTGSWESQYTNSFILSRKSSMNYWIRRILALKLKRNFLPFPNPHLRTNGFLISKNLFHIVTRGYAFKGKNDTYSFESGRAGISRLIALKGLNLIVVGRDGQGFFPYEWSISGTFRQGEQENLLVADNQTRIYAEADASLRSILSQLAWGREF